MPKQIIQPRGMAEAVGPFSRAILIDGHLHIAGTTALSHITGDYYERFVPPTIEEQTRLTLDNIKKCVEAVGGTMEDIYKVVIMLQEPRGLSKNECRAGGVFPLVRDDQHVLSRGSHAARHPSGNRGRGVCAACQAFRLLRRLEMPHATAVEALRMICDVYRARAAARSNPSTHGKSDEICDL